MRLDQFRIKNFRSIVDSGWTAFSPDDVTVVVGQNESGKTSLLEALACAFFVRPITELDFRFDAPLPEIFVRLSVEASEVSPLLSNYPSDVSKAILSHFTGSSKHIEYRFYWSRDDSSTVQGYSEIVAPDLSERLLELKAAAQKSTIAGALAKEEGVASAIDDEELVKELIDYYDLDAMLDSFETLQPTMVLFSDESGLLPNEIDVDDQFKLVGTGGAGARNFLNVAQIELKQLVNGSDSYQANVLSRACKLITDDFGLFWSQTIGGNRPLKLECEVKRRVKAPNLGKPYLVFWITDGNSRLAPTQRSKGLRWFVSFYLQLRASELLGNHTRYFLLDEPGANLHERAQTDVLKLVNAVSAKLAGLAYSTHSPHLIEYERLYRVLAAERTDQGEESPTVITSALKFGASHTDTLSPILTKMGSDLSRQTVISKTNNVILEEISAFFYCQAFWKLLYLTDKPNFIACTGVDNIPQLVNMFLGWGLEFAVVLDDESSARKVYGKLKRNIFGDDESLAAKSMWKITGCDGIEDIFTAEDFKRYVCEARGQVSATAKNSEVMKKNGASKPIVALQFLLDCETGKVKIESFQPESVAAIKNFVLNVSRVAGSGNLSST